MHTKLCLLLCLAVGAASASRDLGTTGRQLLQQPNATDCSRSIANCATCRYQFYKGTTTKAICLSCDAGYQVKNGGRACWCAPGYYRNDPTNFPDRCVKCDFNAYCVGAKATKASGDSHVLCGSNKMTTTEYAKSDRECLAKPGYGWAPGDGSDKCPVGFYNPGNNNRKCTRCPGGLTTANTGTASTQGCVAPAGYYYLRGRAVACARGTWKSDIGNTDCTLCPEGFTTAEGEVSKLSGDDCKYVMPGYSAPASGVTLGTTVATMCPEGSWRSGDSLYTAGSAVNCNTCPAGMSTLPNVTSATSPDACLVKPGFGFNGDSTSTTPGTATECSVGFYNPGWNREVCTDCGLGAITTDNVQSTSADDCKIPAGHGTNRSADGITLFAFGCPSNTYGRPNATYGLVDVECTKCPENTHTNQVNSTGGDQCFTDPGYGWYAGQVLQCEYATYNGGDNQNPCTLCAEGYNTSAPGKTISTDCQVAAGWITDGASGVEPCLRGYFKDWLGSSPNTCRQCPNGTTTTITMAATEESDCDACRPGFGKGSIDLENPECSICGSGWYSPGYVKNGAGCTICPNPSTFGGKMVSRMGVSTPEDCLPEFPTDAAAGLENNQAWDVIWMNSSLELQTGFTTLTTCQSGCSNNPKCQYFEWQQYRGTGNEAQMCYFKLQTADIADLGDIDAGASDVIIFEVAAGKYAAYGAKSGENVDFIGETLDDTSYSTRVAAVDACDKQDACIGITHKAGAGNKWRLFKGTKWEGAVGKVRVVGEAINSWIAEPSAAPLA